MEIVNISFLGSGQVLQDYESKDKNLLTTNFIIPTFGNTKDFVEFFIYDENDTLLSSLYNLNSYKPYQVDPQTNLYTAVSVDPELDLKNQGYNRGTLKVQYNFLRSLFNSNPLAQYWIKEISPSRTEIKLSSQDIGDIAIERGFSEFQTATSTKNYYNDFYLDFGNNELLLGVNVAYTDDDSGAYLLIKLYQPLPLDYDIKSTLWIVEKAAESVSYEVDIQVPATEEVSEFSLRGPNFRVRVNNSLGQTTPYYNYTSLLSSEISSSIQQLKSWYEDKAIQINVDYTNFQNFIHFSSATERVQNFVYKLGLIESYNSQIVSLRTYNGGTGTTKITSSSISTLQKNINRLIEKFDTYEYYLYFSSESFAWPKYNNTKPYQQVSVTSSLATNWLGSSNTTPAGSSVSILFSASVYDAENQNRLTNSIPTYLVDDDTNAPYLTFLDMVGQHFDNLWLYYKDVSNRFDNANNPNKGISKDLVADALRSLGTELYTNSTISDSVYFSLFGINPDGSLLPPTGSEMITKTVTSSLETLASNEIEKEIYKRIYHNLPYLLKSRGTERGIKALLSCYGIPENVLTVKEFGGYNRYQKPGIQDQDFDKITYTTQSLEISSSLLNPYSTLQYYSNDNIINSTDIEVAFSVSDIFNAHITGTLPLLSIENLIGSPGYLLSSSYEALVAQSDSYFRNNYVKRFNLYDYVRLVKYFNNSVFKMIKDFVPARSNIATGIVIKDHILHRNKYARHEPDVDKSSNYSQSIDIAFLEIDAANPISGSTQKSGYFTSSIGYIPYTTTDGVERFTGEFDGTDITITTLNSFNPQFEYSQGSNPNLGIITQSIPVLYHNVSQSLRSRRFFDLDYSYQQNVPVNLDLIEYAISKSESGNPEWETLYNDPNVPFAYLQDYNYSLNAFTIPRYYGSKVQSSKYTYFVDGETGSLGNTAAIDKIKYQFAYLVDIYTASLNLTGRSNSQIKYILDNDQNVTDLTKANTNIFATQNIFKSGEGVNISLFNYDPRNPDVQYLTNKPNLQIYEGGFRYSPILYRISGNSCIDYKIDPPIKITTNTSYTVPGTDGYVPHPDYTVSNVSVDSFDYPYIQGGVIGTRFMISISPVPTLATGNVYVFFGALYENYSSYEYQYIEIPVGSAYAFAFFPDTGLGGRVSSDPSQNGIIDGVYKKQTSSGGTVSTTSTTYLSILSDCDMGTYKGIYSPNSSSIWLSVTQSMIEFYGSVIQNSTYDEMETSVFPISFQKGDMIKLKDQLAYSAKQPSQPEKDFWPESEEYRVVNTQIVTDNNNERRVELQLDRPLNKSTVDNYNVGASVSPFPSAISYFIMNKHVPDETNVILRYAPTSNITQDGILYPEYISETAKQQAGNTIKSLKSQNLIQ